MYEYCTQRNRSVKEGPLRTRLESLCRFQYIHFASVLPFSHFPTQPYFLLYCLFLSDWLLPLAFAIFVLYACAIFLVYIMKEHCTLWHDQDTPSFCPLQLTPRSTYSTRWPNRCSADFPWGGQQFELQMSQATDMWTSYSCHFNLALDINMIRKDWFLPGQDNVIEWSHCDWAESG